mmetsp:Transcript_46281/g.119302  ORF Transcript_46281/g.119302 Transcript_46281/m.119302 type:complete len:181 (+) Transcript_46281:153-695(+)
MAGEARGKDLGFLAIGNKVEVTLKTQNSAKFSGLVYTYDKTSNLAVFEEGGIKEPNLRIVNTAAIKSVKLLEEATGEHLGPPQFNQGLVAGRYNQEFERLRNESKEIGQDVSHEAQILFDALAKTYPCAWQGQSILVLGEVKVNPPYTSECVTALPSASESAIAQVKKVVRIPVVYVLLF